MLVVDDNATNRKLLTRLLAAWQVTTTAVTDGVHALDELHRAVAADKPYDLVLLDFQMPDMDGLEVARRIRDDITNPPPCLLLTSVGVHPDETTQAELGIVGCLSKPLRRHLLLDRLLRSKLAAGPINTFTPSVPSSATIAPLARVLVAEDNLVNQKVTLGLLKKLNLAAEVVSDGQAAVDRFQTGEFDLVLMDCQMPILDGFAATKRIRLFEAEHGKTRTPILALTAGATLAERDDCLDAGMDDFISKPVNPDALVTFLHRHLSNGAAPAPSPSR